MVQVGCYNIAITVRDGNCDCYISYRQRISSSDMFRIAHPSSSTSGLAVQRQPYDREKSSLNTSISRILEKEFNKHDTYSILYNMY